MDTPVFETWLRPWYLYLLTYLLTTRLSIF